MRIVALVGLVAAYLGLGACVAVVGVPKSPSPDAAQVRGALSGQKQRIGAFYATAPDCTTLGYPTLKVSKPPQHGEVSVEQGSTEAAFDKGNVRSACNGKMVAATLVYYTSAPGYVGKDAVAFDRIGVQGAYAYQAYTINVR